MRYDKGCLYEEQVHEMRKKTLALNTILLYIRQIIILFVSLYSVKIVLNELGETDYGIYNVVAGLTVIFSFINSAMTNSTQRYLNCSIGEGSLGKAYDVFAVSLKIHMVISIIFFALSETIGLLFLKHYVNIPLERIDTALWVYHFTVITTIFNIIKIPYQAAIISSENMSFFAEVSILEALLKLAVAFFLKLCMFDKLFIYGLLLSGVSLLILCAYFVYCYCHMEITHYKKCSDKMLLKEMLSFSGWSTLGSFANTWNNQGTSILLNHFLGVTVNASLGIANQINNAVYSFISNFQTAFNPSLVKMYAQGKREELVNLIFLTSKVSFFLSYFMILPLFINSRFVLCVWLGELPEYSAEFVQLILVWSLIDSLNGPMWIAVQARGKIKLYQIITGILIVLNLPISTLLLMMNLPPTSVLYVRIILNIVITVWRILYLNKVMFFPMKKYVADVLVRCFLIIVFSFPICTYIYHFFEGWITFFATCICSVFVNIVMMWFIGLTKSEKLIFSRKIKKILYRIHSCL